MRERAVVRRRRKNVERGVEGRRGEEVGVGIDEGLWVLLGSSFLGGDVRLDEDPESVLKIRKKQKM